MAPVAVYQERLRGQDRLLNFASIRKSEALEEIEVFDALQQDTVTNIAHAFESTQRIVTDSQWLLAMQHLGIPQETVLKIWEEKDDIVQEQKTKEIDTTP